MKRSINQLTVREINSHVFAGTGSCYVDIPGARVRISRARTRKGVIEGRVVTIHRTTGIANQQANALTWIELPVGSNVELWGHGWTGQEFPLAGKGGSN